MTSEAKEPVNVRVQTSKGRHMYEAWAEYKGRVVCSIASPLDAGKTGALERLAAALVEHAHEMPRTGPPTGVDMCGVDTAVQAERERSYVKGWQDACTRVSDCIGPMTMSPHNPSREDLEAAGMAVVRARRVVTRVSRTPATDPPTPGDKP